MTTEMTKYTSTTNPPEASRPEWKATTRRTAIARRPWMSSRRPPCVESGRTAEGRVTGGTVTCKRARKSRRPRTIAAGHPSSRLSAEHASAVTQAGGQVPDLSSYLVREPCLFGGEILGIVRHDVGEVTLQPGGLLPASPSARRRSKRDCAGGLVCALNAKSSRSRTCSTQASGRGSRPLVSRHRSRGRRASRRPADQGTLFRLARYVTLGRRRRSVRSAPPGQPGVCLRTPATSTRYAVCCNSPGTGETRWRQESASSVADHGNSPDGRPRSSRRAGVDHPLKSPSLRVEKAHGWC